MTTRVLTKFEWLYTKHAGMWYPKIAAGDLVKKGHEIGTVGDLFGDTLEKDCLAGERCGFVSHDQSIRARERFAHGRWRKISEGLRD